MKMFNCANHQEARLPYTYQNFSLAKLFVFTKWCQLALERGKQTPADLSGACKYGSLFVNQVFGGIICGHYEHQFNRIDGRIVDLSHDALDVGRLVNPYLHEPEFFSIPEKQLALSVCLLRVDDWVNEFLLVVATDITTIT